MAKKKKRTTKKQRTAKKKATVKKKATARKKTTAKRKPTARKMADWFLKNYKDPVHGVPYNGREGGYQYTNGGPYTALDEVQEHFPEAEFRDVEKAVEIIGHEGDGVTDWVKKEEY
jgi:hypothetical protein